LDHAEGLPFLEFCGECWFVSLLILSLSIDIGDPVSYNSLVVKFAVRSVVFVFRRDVQQIKPEV